MKKRNYKIVLSCYGRWLFTVLLILTLLPVPAAAKTDREPPLSEEGGDIWAAWVYDPATKTMTYSAPGTIVAMALYPGTYENGWYREAKRVVIGEGITEIKEYAFGYEPEAGCGAYTELEEVTLPSTLKVIGEYAFDECDSLNHITLNEGLGRIEARAFQDTALESIEIPGSVEKIGESAFEGDTLRSVIFHEGLKSIGRYAFYFQENLKEVVIPDSVEAMGDGVFCRCSNLKQVTLPVNLKTLQSGMFRGCSRLETIAFPEALEQIDEYVFSGCTNLKRVTLPANLEVLSEGGFYGCTSLKTIAFPESLVQIESDVFTYTDVRNITIPSNVERLGTKYKDKFNYRYVEGMFKGCKRLKKVRIKSRKLKKVYPKTFVNTPKNVVFVVPNGLKKKYTKLLRKGGLPKKVKIKEAKRI